MTTPTKQSPDTLPRVYRGGSWFFTTVTVVLATYRYGSTPLYRNFDIGFRTSQTVCRLPLDRA